MIRTALGLAALIGAAFAQPAPELVVQIGHSLPVTAVALSRDSKLLATGSRDGTAILWEASTGRKLREIKAEPLGVTAVAISPDGTRLLTGGAGTARLWDAETGGALATLGVPGEFLRAALFTPDGLSAVTAGDDGTAKLWDLKTGRRKRAFGPAPARIASLALSSDGKRLALVAGGADIWIWDVDNGTILQQLTGAGPWTAVAFSLDGRSVIAGGPRDLSVWDIASGRENLSFKGDASRAVAAAGSMFAACGGASTAKLWKAGEVEPTRSLIGHADAVEAMAVATDGRLIATGSEDHTARLWDAGTGAEIRTFGGAALPVLYAAVSSDGARLVTVDPQKAALWDLAGGRLIARSTGDWESAAHFAVTRDGRYLASLRDREMIDLRDLEQGKDLGTYRWNLLKAHALALDAAGQFLVTAREENLQAWEIPDQKEKAILGGHKERAGWLAVGLAGRRLVTRAADGAVALWDLESGRRIARFKLEAHSLPDIILSRDGRFLAAGAVVKNDSGGASYAVTVRALEGGEELRSGIAGQVVEPMVLGPDGESLLVAAQGGVWSWDLANGQPQKRVQMPDLTVLDWPDAIDPDWKYLWARREDALSAIALSSGKELGRLRLFEKGWLVTAADGRFDASPDAARWTVGLKSYPLEKFAAQNLMRGLLGRLLKGDGPDR